MGWISGEKKRRDIRTHKYRNYINQPKMMTQDENIISTREPFFIRNIRMLKVSDDKHESN
jgi:hypothetical protein